MGGGAKRAQKKEVVGVPCERSERAVRAKRAQEKEVVCAISRSRKSRGCLRSRRRQLFFALASLARARGGRTCP